LNNNIEKTFKALIEIPTWLGDSIMTTPAIENIINHYNDIDITVIGSNSCIEVFKKHPKVVKTIALDTKIKSLYISYTELGFFDVYFSFRGSLRAKLLKLTIKAKKKYQDVRMLQLVMI